REPPSDRGAAPRAARRVRRRSHESGHRARERWSSASRAARRLAIGIGPLLERLEIDRQGTVAPPRGSRAELPVGIGAPAPDVALPRACAGVIVAGGDLDDPREPRDANVLVVRTPLHPELAVGPDAPAVHRTVARERARVMEAAHQRVDRRQVAALGRAVAALGEAPHAAVRPPEAQTAAPREVRDALTHERRALVPDPADCGLPEEHDFPRT